MEQKVFMHIINTKEQCKRLQIGFYFSESIIIRKLYIFFIIKRVKARAIPCPH